MKLYTIAMTLFIIQLSTTYVTTWIAPEVGISSEIAMSTKPRQDFEDARKQFENSTIESGTMTSDDPLTRVTGFVSEAIVSAISTAFEPLRNFVLAFPLILMMLGAPAELAAVMSVPLYVIEFIAIIQFATGKSFKDIE